MNNDFLIIVRGLPGSGKTTTALTIAGTTYSCFAADDFFYDNEGVYKFDFTKLGIAHKTCFDNTEKALRQREPVVIVHNTFVKEREINPYKKLAEKYNYKFISLIAENRHGNSSVHNVPQVTLDKMLENFSIKL